MLLISECLAGQCTVRGYYKDTGAGLQIGRPLTLSEAIVADFILIHCRGIGDDQRIKAAVYADDAGAPGALIAVTEDAVGTAAAFFSSPVSLSAGDYWLAFLSDGSLERDYDWDTSNKAPYKLSIDYDTGFSDPWGSSDGTSGYKPRMYLGALIEKTGVSKANSYVVLAPPSGTVVSKGNAYAVLSTATDISLAKAVGYAVVQPAPDTTTSTTTTTTTTTTTSTTTTEEPSESNIWINMINNS